MSIELCKVIIAAYLHDMGKLLRRGGLERKTTKYKVPHAQQVFDFFHTKDYVQIERSNFWKEIGLVASLHHGKDFGNYTQRKNEEEKKLARTVYMADNISSKERVDEKNLEGEKIYEHIKHFGLRTVFENIFSLDR
jgi:CRISPR/Cas system-associated protein Cas10 (large subunit of type III CRISPR-Cas system)